MFRETEFELIVMDEAKEIVVSNESSPIPTFLVTGTNLKYALQKCRHAVLTEL